MYLDSPKFRTFNIEYYQYLTSNENPTVRMNSIRKFIYKTEHLYKGSYFPIL